MCSKTRKLTPVTNGMEREAEPYFPSYGGEYLTLPLGAVELGHRAYAYLVLAEVFDAS